VSQSALANDKLRRVCAVEAIYAIGPTDPILKKHLAAPNRAAAAAAALVDVNLTAKRKIDYFTSRDYTGSANTVLGPSGRNQ